MISLSCIVAGLMSSMYMLLSCFHTTAVLSVACSHDTEVSTYHPVQGG